VFEIEDSVIKNFDKFVANVCKWIQVKILPKADQTYNGGDDGGDSFGKGKVNIGDYAVNVIQAWGQVFCGFGAYSVQEVLFLAGQSCHLTVSSQA